MAEQNADSPTVPASQLWQLPVLAVGLVLFGIGLFLAAPDGEPRDVQRQLKQAAAHLDAGRYEKALKQLERISRSDAKVPERTRRRILLLTGDALHLGQESKGWSLPVNHQRAVHAYRKARELGAELSHARNRRLAESMAAAGQRQEALKLLAEMGEHGAEMRQGLLKRMIRGALDAEPTQHKRADRLIGRLLDEPSLKKPNEVWAIARRAELMMARDRTDEAINMLLRRIARLQGEGQPPLGELMVQLGRAYLKAGEPDPAERWFLRAQQNLESDDPLNARVLLGLGRIRFGEDNVIEALEHFAGVVERFKQHPAYPPALVGKAEAEARRGAVEQALADYTDAVELVQSGRAEPELREHLAKSLRTQHDLRFGQGQYEPALSFIELERKLYRDGEMPAELHMRTAMSHERMAKERMGIEAEAGDEAMRRAWDKLSEDRRNEVANRLAAAAKAYRRHARAVTTQNNDAYGRSLWKAADYYDKAGRHEKAIAVFREFVDGRPSDPKRLAAMHRLAQAYQAAQRFDKAIELYKRLVEEHPKSPEAYSSLVPLARSYLAKGGTKNTALAEQVLRSVINDHPSLRPESTEYRRALIELGQLYYRRGDEGDYEKAIQHLEEAVERYPKKGNRPKLTFQLADAYRKSVQQIEKKLDGALPPSKRASLESERTRRLKRAKKHFTSVVEAYRKKDPTELTDLRQLYLRNSYFYRADCAYDLGQYKGPDGAITLYEKAQQRYDEDPAALVALVQIVNSYAELGQWKQARRANERAKVYLERIPEQAFQDPNLPMSREHWQRWLDWTNRMALKGEKKTAKAGAP